MDYNALLQPISPDSASGVYLKSDRTVYRNLRNYFNTAQSSFRRLIETPDSSSDEVLFQENLDNWQQLADECWSTLTEKSKDIEIYGWWLMSLTFQRQGLTKTAQGLETLPAFIQQFWPNVHPKLPDDKLKTTEAEQQLAERAEIQLRPLIQLLGESEGSGLLYMPLQMMSLVGDIDHSAYLSANKTGKLDELKAQAIQDFPAVKADVIQTITDLDQAINAVTQLDAWLNATCSQLGLANITGRFLKTSLQNCLDAIKYLVGESFPRWPLDPAPETVTQVQEVQPQNTATAEPATTAPSAITEALVMTPTQLQGRDQAFQELRRIADYFAQTEPHSPVSYLLEKAIRWGYLPLPELMQELMEGNEKVLNHVNLITGIDSAKATLPDIPNQVATNSTTQVPTASAASAPAETPDNNTSPQTEEQEIAPDSGFSWDN